MHDDRRRFVVWGFLAVVLAAVVLLSATALFGSENRLAMRLLWGAISTASLALGAACLGLALRGIMHTALTGIGSRLKKQTDDLIEAQDRRQAELMARVANVEERSQEMLLEINDALQATVDTLEYLGRDGEMTSRVLRAQGEEITTIRKQTRVGHDAAIDGREIAKKLLNVVRSESMSNREDVLRAAAESRNLLGRFNDIEAGQRRVLNFLRRDGNIQIVLDRLEASERRTLNSVEGGALTVAEELSGSAERANSELRVEMRAATEGLERVREDLGLIKQELDGSTPRMEDLVSKLGGVAQSVDGLSGSILDLGGESSRALARLEDSTTGALSQVETSLQHVTQRQEDAGTLAKKAFDSHAGAEQVVDKLHTHFHDLQTRWHALEQAWDATSGVSPTEFNAGASSDRQATGLAPAVKSLVSLTDVLKNDVKSLHRHVDRAGVETVRQTEALLQLLPRMRADSRRLPASGGFAMAPDSLLLLSDLIAENKPKRILEIGSGTSTIWLASFAAPLGSSVISIEHLEKYRVRTQSDLRAFGLEETVDLRLAELAPVEVMGETKPWYDLEALQDLSSIDVVVVDGPPESTGPAPRSPAFPLLRSILSDRALLVVDDVHRNQESQMVEEWLDFDQDLERTTWEAGRTAVLEYRRGRRRLLSDATSESQW